MATMSTGPWRSSRLSWLPYTQGFGLVGRSTGYGGCKKVNYCDILP